MLLLLNEHITHEDKVVQQDPKAAHYSRVGNGCCYLKLVNLKHIILKSRRKIMIGSIVSSLNCHSQFILTNIIYYYVLCLVLISC